MAMSHQAIPQISHVYAYRVMNVKTMETYFYDENDNKKEEEEEQMREGEGAKYCLVGSLICHKTQIAVCKT